MVIVKTMLWEEISFILLHIFRENKLLKVLFWRKKDLPFLFKMYDFFFFRKMRKKSSSEKSMYILFVTTLSYFLYKERIQKEGERKGVICICLLNMNMFF